MLYVYVSPSFSYICNDFFSVLERRQPRWNCDSLPVASALQTLCCCSRGGKKKQPPKKLIHAFIGRLLAVAYAHRLVAFTAETKINNFRFWYPPIPKNTAVGSTGAASRNFPKGRTPGSDGSR